MGMTVWVVGGIETKTLESEVEPKKERILLAMMSKYMKLQSARL